jgi:thiol-disulfide isomerase/thioredoxin
MKTIFLISLAAVVSVPTALAQQAATQVDRYAEVKALVGKPLPKFQMKLLTDKVITNKDIQGKVVVFDFWATWCGPCKAAAPKLEAIYQEFKGKNFEIIGANLAETDANDKRVQTKDNAVAYVNEHKYTYAFTYGNDAIGKEWKVPGYPTFFIVGRDGIVKEVMVGFNEKRMRELVAELTK